MGKKVRHHEAHRCCPRVPGMVLYGALDQCVFLLSGSEMDKHRVCPGSRPPKVKRLHRLGNYQTQSLSERAFVVMSLVRLALPPTKVIAHNSPQRVLGFSFSSSSYDDATFRSSDRIVSQSSHWLVSESGCHDSAGHLGPRHRGQLRET